MTPAESWQTLVGKNDNNNEIKVSPTVPKSTAPSSSLISQNLLPNDSDQASKNNRLDHHSAAVVDSLPQSLTKPQLDDGNQTELDEEPIEGPEISSSPTTPAAQYVANDHRQEEGAAVLVDPSPLIYRSEDDAIMSSSFYTVNETKCVTEEEEEDAESRTKTKKIIEHVKTTVYEHHNVTTMQQQQNVVQPRMTRQRKETAVTPIHGAAILDDNTPKSEIRSRSTGPPTSTSQRLVAIINIANSDDHDEQQLQQHHASSQSPMIKNSASSMSGMGLNKLGLNKNVLDKFVRSATTNASASLLNLASSNSGSCAGGMLTSQQQPQMTKTSSSNLLALCGPVDTSPESSTSALGMQRSHRTATTTAATTVTNPVRSSSSSHVLRSSMNVSSGQPYNVTPQQQTSKKNTNRLSNISINSSSALVSQKQTPIIMSSVSARHQPTQSNNRLSKSAASNFETQLESILNGVKSSVSNVPGYRVPSSRHFCGRLMSTKQTAAAMSSQSSSASTCSSSQTTTQATSGREIAAQQAAKYLSASSASPSGSTAGEDSDSDFESKQQNHMAALSHHHHQHRHRSQSSLLSTTSSPSTASSSPRSSSSNHLSDKTQSSIKQQNKQQPLRSASDMNAYLSEDNMLTTNNYYNNNVQPPPIKQSNNKSVVHNMNIKNSGRNNVVSLPPPPPRSNTTLGMQTNSSKALQEYQTSTAKSVENLGSRGDSTRSETQRNTTIGGESKAAGAQIILRQIQSSQKDISSIGGVFSDSGTINQYMNNNSNQTMPMAVNNTNRSNSSAEVALTKSIRDLKLYVSNSYSPSLIVKPPPAGASLPVQQQQPTSLEDEETEKYSDGEEYQNEMAMNDNHRSSTTNLSSVSNRILQSEIPVNNVRSSSNKPLAKTSSNLGSNFGPDRLLQTNLLTYKSVMVQPLKDERSNQVRMEFLQQQAMLSKIQKQELKEYLRQKEAALENIRKMSNNNKVAEQQIQNSPKLRSVTSAEIENKRATAMLLRHQTSVSSSTHSNSSKKHAMPAMGTNNGDGDTLINCILEMKPPPPSAATSQPPLENRRKISGINNNSSSSSSGRKIQATGSNQTTTFKTSSCIPASNSINLASSSNNVVARNFHVPTIKGKQQVKVYRFLIKII